MNTINNNYNIPRRHQPYLQPISLLGLFKLVAVSSLLLLNPAEALCPISVKLDSIARSKEPLLKRELERLKGPTGMDIKEEPSLELLKNQYKYKALLCHPDRNKAENSNAQFQTLANIYDRLYKEIASQHPGARSSSQSSFSSKEKTDSLSPVDKAEQIIIKKLKLPSNTEFKSIHTMLTDLDLDELSLEDAALAIIKIVQAEVPFEDLNKAHPLRLAVILKHADETISLLGAGANFADIAELHRGDLETLFKNHQHTCTLLNKGQSVKDLFGCSSETLSSPEETRQAIIKQLNLPADTQFERILKVLTGTGEHSLSLESGVSAVVRIVKKGEVPIAELDKAHELRLPILLDRSKEITALLKSGVSFSEIADLHRSKLVTILTHYEAVCALLDKGSSFSNLIKQSTEKLEQLLARQD